ncbi:MAG TPA: hypothetical protein VHP37_07040 [Burkholderiales bacterium]|nr:hypothetical protein [Burkholderiales bacterium]
MIRRRVFLTNAAAIAAACYIAALPLFVLFADATYPLAARLAAWLLFVVGTVPTVVYLRGARSYVPVVELVQLAFVSAFSLPVFYERELAFFARTIYPDTVPVTACILLAVVAVSALWCGYKLGPNVFARVPLPRFQFRCVPERLFYYAIALGIASMIRTDSFGPFEQVVNAVASQDLITALLALLFYKKVLAMWQKALAVAVVAGFVVNGISTGMTQAMLQPAMIWFICRWIVVKKLEISLVVGAVLAVILIQPVKLQYRDIAWTTTTPMSHTEKVALFGDLFVKHWLGAEIGSARVSASSANRTSLLLQTAHILDWSPEVVPYENGHTYMYLVVGWVPRFLWPDKPIAQVANNKYALNYGVTTEEGIERTMFGVGELGEAIMNFGAVGVFPVFLILGILTYIPLRLLTLPNFERLRAEPLHADHIGALAVLVAVVARLIFIGSSTAGVYGGIVQLILVQAALMYLCAGDKSAVARPRVRVRLR